MKQLITLLVLLVPVLTLGQQKRDLKAAQVYQAILPDSLKGYMTTITQRARLMSQPDYRSNVRGSVSPGDSVKVLYFKDGFFQVVRVEFGSVGFVPELSLKKSEELTSIRDLFHNQNNITYQKYKAYKDSVELAEKAYKDSLMAAYNKEKLSILVKAFGEVNGKRVFNKEYWIGMTDEMAELSLGKPDDINRTVTSRTVKEQWVYSKYGIYLYFTNGLLTSYQN